MKKFSCFKTSKVLFVVCVALSLIAFLYLFLYEVPQVAQVNGFFEPSDDGYDFLFYCYHDDSERGFYAGEQISLNFNENGFEDSNGIINQVDELDFYLTTGRLVKYAIHLNVIPEELIIKSYYQVNLIQAEKIRLINFFLQ